MALPATITVVGTLLGIDGLPEKGHVSFYSTVSALSSGDDTVVVPSAKLVTLDETGSFSITLPASDDPEWTPVGWTYKVAVRAGDSKYGFETVIPYDAPGSEINFSELVPALDGGSELYATYSHTHEGSGPGGSTAWTDITGKPSTFPPSTHTHSQSDVTGLTTALAGKAATVHTHAISDVTSLQTALDAKAATTHTHAIADTTGLQTALNNKADDSEITALDGRLDVVEARTQILVLDSDDPVPGGTPTGTVIVRTA